MSNQINSFNTLYIHGEKCYDFRHLFIDYYKLLWGCEFGVCGPSRTIRPFNYLYSHTLYMYLYIFRFRMSVSISLSTLPHSALLLVRLQLEDFSGYAPFADDLNLYAIAGVDVTLCGDHKEVFHDGYRLVGRERFLRIQTILVANLICNI
jgi:hypothetical protein